MKVFLSTWRFYFSILLILGSIICLFQGDIASFLSGTAVGILFVAPELIYFFTPAEKIWARWADTEASQKQLDRLERARNGELTPQWTDSKGKCAKFVGSSGGAYKTTLKKCTCPDFKKRKAPCKHMYYLADECGLLK